MKKIFALALAAVMTAGMATTAFALDADRVVMISTGGSYVFVDNNDNNKFGDKAGEVNRLAPISTSKDDLTSIDLSVIKGGKKVAIPLFYTDGTPMTEKDQIKGYKVKSEWSVGDLDDKANIELVKLDLNADGKGKYVYCVTFVMPEAAETKDSDLAGQISVYKNSSDLKDDNKDKKFYSINFGSTYGYSVQDYKTNKNLDKAEIVNFDDCDVETLTFGDILEFEVDVTGQGKLNLKWNEDFNKEFAAMYDYANIDFVNFEKTPSFNKNGVAYIYADEDAFVYEVTENGAKAIKGLKWDEDYEAWTFKTRTLGSDAIADVELDEKTATEDKNESSKPETGKENPDTGR